MMTCLLANAPRKSHRLFIANHAIWEGKKRKKKNILFFRLYNCNLSLLFYCKTGKQNENDIVSEVSPFLIA